MRVGNVTSLHMTVRDDDRRAVLDLDDDSEGRPLLVSGDVVIGAESAEAAQRFAESVAEWASRFNSEEV